ncbi:MAG TPA: erythromycin esterase family protein [Gemmatimonadaceae bacterium]|nr:erythromycin esterase family protein [Gemmatimonadaceae bacterium]
MRRSNLRMAHDGGVLADLASAVGHDAIPMQTARDLDPLMEMVGDARYVLLGEASHGTSEFYTWRTEISKRLIREKGFTFIGVEGDWPDCYRVNRFIRSYPNSGESARDVLHAFSRWPTWMWANEEVVELATWLRRYNNAVPAERQAGFYGLDVYSLYESLDAVITYLERVDPSAVDAARRAYRCFEPYGEDVQEYARATALVPTSCEDEAISMLQELRSHAAEYREDGREAYFNAEQNAIIARNGELYYRTMVRGGAMSWNVRDHHMTETLEHLLEFHGPTAKGIVWAHNTHVGDARFTDMSGAGMVNLGQLVRQGHSADGVVLVGCSTHRGSVIAAREWGLPMQRMRVPEAQQGSYDDVLHRSGAGNFMLLFADESAGAARPGLEEVRGHRAIGVVYDPRVEHWGNYVPTVLPQRYDAVLFVDETHAVSPLHMPVHVEGEPPETYPSGM